MINTTQPPELNMEPQFSEQFLQGMVDRMILSGFKYGDLKLAFPGKVSAMKSMKQRIDRYQTTGNTEDLIDAANFLMIEFMRPRHPKAHFKATDSGSSPGRTWRSGIVSAGANTLALQDQHEAAEKKIRKHEGD